MKREEYRQKITPPPVVPWYKRKRNIIALISAITATLLIGITSLWYMAPSSRAARNAKAMNHNYASLVMKNKMKRPIDTKYQPLSEKAKQQLAKQGVDYDPSKVTTPDVNELAALRRKYPVTSQRLIGQISIPQYHIDVPVYQGISEGTLAWGAGTAMPNEHMGSGNFAVEAHNFIKCGVGIADNWFFSNFQTRIAPYGAWRYPSAVARYVRIPTGTNVYAYDGNNVYTYQICKRQIVNVTDPNAGVVLAPQEVERLKAETGGKPLITMATCFIQSEITYPKQRIVLTGKLVNTTPASQFHNLKQVFKYHK